LATYKVEHGYYYVVSSSIFYMGKRLSY